MHHILRYRLVAWLTSQQAQGAVARAHPEVEVGFLAQLVCGAARVVSRDQFLDETRQRTLQTLLNVFQQSSSALVGAALPTFLNC